MKFIRASMEQVISVSKRSNNSGKRRHYQAKNKHWRVYFLDEDGSFRSQRIHWYEVLKYKHKKVKRIYDK